jgi:hypothetical protein
MTKDTTPTEPTAYFVSEFCKKFIISKTSFYREVNAGRLMLLKRGKRSIVDKAEAERWYTNLPKSLGQLNGGIAIPPHTQPRGPSTP